MLVDLQNIYVFPLVSMDLHRKSSKVYSDNSFRDNIELKHAIHDNSSSSTMDTSAVTMTEDKVNIFIVFVFILELLVLVFVSVLEYFLR